MYFVPNKLFQSVRFGKPFDKPAFVFERPFHQITGHTGIERSVGFVGDDVDVVLFLQIRTF